MSENAKPFDKRTAEALESAVQLLGGTEQAKNVVTYIYHLGRLDGGMAMCDRLSQKLAASP